MLFCSLAVIILLMPSQKRKGHPPYPLIPWWGLARCLELAPLRGLKIRNVAPVRPPGVNFFLLCPLWVCCLWTAISFVFLPLLGLSNKHIGKRFHISFALALWRFISFLLYPSTYYLFFLDYLFVWKRIKTKRKKIVLSRWPTYPPLWNPYFWGRNLDFICIPSCDPPLPLLWYPFFWGHNSGDLLSLSHVFFPSLFFPST